MADVVTFDPVNRLIIEINAGSAAVNEISATEIYSEWKAWLLADPSRLGNPQAFSPVGGDPRTLTQNLGITYFLENGWRIRPAEYDHKLTVTGNIFTREPGQSVFKKTVGTFNVHTETVVSNIIDTVDQTLQTQQQYLIESLRDDHQAGGLIFYWNPVTGSDSNDGRLPTKARLTFASIHNDLIISGRGDIVFILREGGSQITITERIVITKHSVFIRAPGNTRVIPSVSAGPSVDVSGGNCSITGLSVYNVGGGHPAIRATGGNFRMESSQVITSTGNGVEIIGGSANFIERVLIRGCTGHGILIRDTQLCNVERAVIQSNQGWGIKYEATTPGSCALLVLDYGVSQANTLGGVSIGSGVFSVSITDRFHVAVNASQTVGVSNAGIATENHPLEQMNRVVDATWDEGLTPHATTDSAGKLLLELYRLAGLDPTKPLVVAPTSRKIPADGSNINQTISESGGVITVTRT